MNNHKTLKYLEAQYDECTIKGICSISPTMSLVKAAFFAYLEELSFYLKKIKTMNIQNKEIKNHFIDIFSVLITNTEYSDDVLHKVILTIQEGIFKSKENYKQLCEENNATPKFFKPQIKLPHNFTINDFIKQGKKFDEKFKRDMSPEQVKGLETVFVILKSICLNIIELQSLNVDFDKYYEEIVFALCIRDKYNLSLDTIKEYIIKYSTIDNELMEIVFEARKKEFGEFIETEILITPKKGQCILVAGTNIKELELILEATKDKNIDIYTHGQMITGHTFSKLKQYSHLVGHYGKGSESYMTDFTRFPGPIFLTNLSLFKVDSLYFSSIYTTNTFTPLNTKKVTDYNFEPIIKSALMAEGFEETPHEKRIKFGITKEFVEKEINNIVEKIKNKEIKNIITIGVSNKTEVQIEYFKKFLTLLDKTCYVISSSYTNDSKNVLLVNIDYVFPFLCKLLNILAPLKDSFDLKINLLYTRCEPHSMPNIFYLKQMNLANIYFHQCSPLLINPALIDFSFDLFNVKRYTTPENDFREMTER